MVIYNELNEREFFSRDRRELIHIHAEATVARDIHDHAVRLRSLRADGRTEAEAHGAETAAREIGSRAVVRIVLRRPHLVLADLGHNDRIVRREPIQLPNHARPREPLADLQRETLLPRLNLRDPVRVPLCRQFLCQTSEQGRRVADQGSRDMNVLIDLSLVNVNLQDFRLCRKLLRASRDTVGKARADHHE